jgi:2-aminoethylphosphonate-pyruvate transaminase
MTIKLWDFGFILETFLLFTPGPVNVSETLRNAVSKRDIGHREPEFDELLTSIEQKLISLFQIKKRSRYRAVVITGSGTAANESILSSVVGKGSILILSNGEFGERLHKTSCIYNKKTHLLRWPWGTPLDPVQIESYMATHKIDVVAMAHHETCSGMLNPLNEIGAITRAHSSIFVVDGVSSVGAEIIDMEQSNISFCSSSSSKAIGSYPGLSFVIGRKKHFENLKRHVAKTSYLNLATIYHFLKTRGQTPNTPAVPLFFALEQALANILKEGVTKRFATIKARADQIRLGLRKLNLEFVIPEADMCSVLTTVRMPPNISFHDLRDRLREKSIIIYEGKGCFAGNAFQVGNIGELSSHNIQYLLMSLKEILQKIHAKTSEVVIPIKLNQSGNIYNIATLPNRIKIQGG